MPEIIDTIKGSPAKVFGNERQKNFGGSFWYFPPLLIHKIFHYRKFSETQHRRVPLRSFSVVRDKKNFDRNSRYNPFKHKMFRHPKIVTHQRFPLRSFSAHWDEKILTEKRDITLLGKWIRHYPKLMTL